jgi:hypothetical protein
MLRLGKTALRALKCLGPAHPELLYGLLRVWLALTYNVMNDGEGKHISRRKGMKRFYQSLKGSNHFSLLSS